MRLRPGYRALRERKTKRGASAPLKDNLLDVVAKLELSDELTILVDIVGADVAKQRATVADEHQQATTAVEVVGMLLAVLGELTDASGEKSDLNAGGTGVVGILAELSDDSGLLLL